MNEKIKSSSGSGGAGPGGGIAINSGSGVSSGNSTTNVQGGSPVGSGGGAGVGLALSHNVNDGQQIIPPPHPYGPPGGGESALMAHYLHQQAQPHPHMPPHPSQNITSGPGPHTNSGEHPNKDDYGQNTIGSAGGPPVSVPSGHHPMYGRYHHADPSMDPYRYSHSPMQQQPPLTSVGKPQQSLMAGGGSGGLSSSSRPPPQRYIPGQPPQGPTPTLNSLLQSSHPPPHPQHRYTNNYDVASQQQQQQSQQTSQSNVGSQQQQQQQSHGGPQPPPPHQQIPYGQQGGWTPSPRPYSPQLNLSQQYRPPPLTNSSRGQSPYGPTHGGQNSGSYPNSSQQVQQQQQQQGGGPGNNTSAGVSGSSVGPPPPPPQSSNQGTTPSPYSVYPQRYTTPSGPISGPSHRTAYSTHQYPEPNRPWPGSSSPAPSPGPGNHPLPPVSPHHGQHGGPPPSSSPSHAPSPSPQPSQASPSPHQELISQNSNDSSSGGGHSGTPNSQQVMRPTPSPTGSSGSRSMSPAVAQNHQISRPSSNQSSSGSLQQPGIGGPSTVVAPGQGPPQQNASGNVPSQQGPPSNSTSVGGQPGTQQLPPLNQNMNNMPPQSQLSQTAGGPSVYPLPPHMHGSYKISGSNTGPQGLLTGYPPPPPQQAQQYSQGSYLPRPQYPPNSYASAPPASNQPSVNNMPPNSGSQQYSSGRPIPNHGGPSPYPPYQGWVPQTGQHGALTPGTSVPSSSNHVQSKGTAPPPQSAGSPRPLNYLKQHLQHKSGYAPSNVSQGYGNGPGMHPGGMPMGPPHHMGPPHGPINMGPPTSTSNQSILSSIPPGPVAVEISGGPPPPSEHISQDNGISSSGSSNSAPGAPHPVTSVVTTGPDGTTMDEVSQQSSLSNASAASGEDPQCPTPKSRKNDLYGQSHLAPPSTSPGSLVGPHQGGGPVDDYEMNSPPNWPRTPASPGFNSHVPQPDAFRNVGGSVTSVSVSAVNKKSDSLCKLYEMDEDPERRLWLDKLRAFMDERRTPITACPTISKQPLDLFRLYLYVKQRGGFVEVTKSKIWKDIAGLLGIGASSSAAYTLRKHYTKNLLAFECHYDRGDIDPLPIIQQVEAGTKKKTTKPASVPSPAGSSNSQDSFPAPGGGANNPMDGYPPYSGAYSSGGPQPDYNPSGQMPRPPSQNNTQTSHPGNNQIMATQSVVGGGNLSAGNPFEDSLGSGGGSGSNSNSNVGADGAVGSGTTSPCTTSNVINTNHNNNNNNGPRILPAPSPTVRLPYHAAGGSFPPPMPRTPGSPYPGQPGNYGQYVSNEQYNAAPGAPAPFSQQQGQFPLQNRNMYPPYGTEGEAPPAGSNQYGPYGNRPYNQPPPSSSQTPAPPGATSNAAGSVTGAGSAATTTGPYTSGQQDYYRPPDQNPQPRRHPDFVKDSQPYLGYSARPQIYGGWQGPAANQYRNQYPPSPSTQAWVGAPLPRTVSPSGGPLIPGQQTSTSVAVAQWEQQHRYPSQQQPIAPSQQAPYQQQPSQQQPAPPPQWAQMGNPAATAVVSTSGPGGGAPGCSLRPPISQQQQQRMASPASNCVPGGHAPPQQGPSVVSPQSTINTNSSAGSTMVSKTPFSMPPPQATVNTTSIGPTCIPGVINGPQKTITAPIGPPSAAPVQQPPVATPFIQLAKKEIVFPPDSVEATTPVLYKRKRLTKVDVCPVDPWRLFMSMRSGLLAECTWALDILNVLLFDDTTVQYFGLANLPGLLTLLLEHFQKALSEMFGDETEETYCKKNGIAKKKICNSISRKTQHLELNCTTKVKDNDPIDLGQIQEPPNPEERLVILTQTPNYTLMSRKGLPVRLQPAENDIFVTNNIKVWDVENSRHNFEETTPLACNAWTYGYTEQNSGIVDVFKSEIIDIPFARYIKNGKGRGTCSIKCSKNKTEVERIPHSSSKADLIENEKDAEFESRGQQNVYNKKRRFFCNSTLTKLEPLKAKKLKFQINDGKEEEDDTKKVTESDDNKREDRVLVTISNNTDSDCREVDMELETIGTSKEMATNITKVFDPKVTARDPALVLERRRSCSNLEDECYTRDESSLYLVNESQDSLARRCICISNIFRNLSFVPGNETILAKSPRFLAVLGHLLLLYHEHLPRPPKNRNYDRGFEEDYDFSDSCSSLHGEQEWWWDYLISIRENMLVIIANIAGHLELTRYEELIARPLIDGLLHWAVCPSSHGQDPFPSCGPTTLLSPQRLALEALCKLCVTDNNVDLVIATPPFSRLEKLCAVLTRHLCRNEDQVLREFSVNLLHYLAAADSAMSRTVAMQSPCISYLVAFIEQAEQTALGVANQHGINYLRENPDSMGTSLDMLRRTAGTLLHLAKHPDNRSLFMQQEQRLLGLVMSHILDQQVALIISRVLYQVSRGPGTTSNSLEYRLQQKQQLKNENTDKKALNRDLVKIELGDANTTTTVTGNICDNSTTAASANAINVNNKIASGSTSMSTSLASNVMASADSENSNSSCQTSSATASFNDVSNSSTNSNSCGTVASSHSNHSVGSGNTNINNVCNNTLSNNCTSSSNNIHANTTTAVSFGQSTKTLSTSEHVKNNILTGVIAAAASNNTTNSTNRSSNNINDNNSNNNNNDNNSNNNNNNNDGNDNGNNINGNISTLPPSATSGLAIVAPPPLLPPSTSPTAADVSSAATVSTTTTTTAAVA